MKMISVADKMPEKFKIVLLINKFGPCKAAFSTVVGYLSNNGFCASDDGLTAICYDDGSSAWSGDGTSTISLNMPVTHWAEIEFE